MRVESAVLAAVFLVCLATPGWSAGPFPTKGKRGKGKVKVKDTGAPLMPATDTVVSNWGIMLCDAQTGATIDGPRVLTPKYKKKTGEVKLWSFKEKKVAVIKYKPAKRKLIYKVWTNVPDAALVGVVSPDMVCVPSGTFTMGNSESAAEGNVDELPTHQVTLSTFFIDKYEVSNAKMRDVLQWALGQNLITTDMLFVRNAEGNQQVLLSIANVDCQITFTGGMFAAVPGKYSNPCVFVTWYGACAYCNFRSLMEGKTPCYDLADWSCDWDANGYRLPSEAEWEKAARGGDAGTRFPWSDIQTISHARANYYSGSSLTYDTSSNAGYHPSFSTGAKPYTNPCGVFIPNGYGLYDVAGNVWEWVWDRWDAGYYAASPSFNPTGPEAGSDRTLRSGSWMESAHHCRVSNRGGGKPPNSAYYHFGFRAVCR
jgi:formylglycine-generating enzyme required for sulfatase activity